MKVAAAHDGVALQQIFADPVFVVEESVGEHHHRLLPGLDAGRVENEVGLRCDLHAIDRTDRGLELDVIGGLWQLEKIARLAVDDLLAEQGGMPVDLHSAQRLDETGLQLAVEQGVDLDVGYTVRPGSCVRDT